MPDPALEKELQAFVGASFGPPEMGEDLVNEPMIRHWCEILGDENPVYTDSETAARSAHGGLVAPPTMLQAWILPGLELARTDAPPKTKQHELLRLLAEHGYPSVVGTDCEQGYDRYLRPGDRVTVEHVIEAISEQKATALGLGYFYTSRSIFTDQHGERVGWMRFRLFVFQPAQAAKPVADAAAPATPKRIRAPRTHDNGWWWEAIDAGELRIQRCADCGALRHPPRPMCPKCRSPRWDSILASGEGSVHSYVVMHHPPIPGYEYPLAVGLIDLAEGTRLVSNLVGCEHEGIHIGMPVECAIEAIDDELRLPVFRPVR